MIDLTKYKEVIHDLLFFSSLGIYYVYFFVSKSTIHINGLKALLVISVFFIFLGIFLINHKYSKSSLIIIVSLYNNQRVGIIQSVLILPTRAECAGVVFESGFGVPTLTTDTGGVSNYVKNGVNSYRLLLSAIGKEFADMLEEIIQNDELPSLSEKCKKMYRESNSWDAFGKKINVLVDEIVN